MRLGSPMKQRLACSNAFLPRFLCIMCIDFDLKAPNFYSDLVLFPRFSLPFDSQLSFPKANMAGICQSFRYLRIPGQLNKAGEIFEWIESNYPRVVDHNAPHR